jgi:hypothetical protein
MKIQIVLISLLLLMVLSACTVLDNFPTAATPEGQPVSSPAEPEPAVVNPPTAENIIENEIEPVEATPDSEVIEPGVDDTPEETLTVLSDEAFDLQLARTIEDKDLDTLKWMMGARFSFLSWNTELREVSSDEAIEKLRQELFVQSAQPVVIFGTDIVALLNNAGPLVQWGPVANPVRAMHVMGLGSNGAQEAIFVIARDSNGYRYLHGVILPPGGYFQAFDPKDDRVVETDVRHIMAQTNVRMRTGPGFEYAQEDLLFEGQIALVTGKSRDGAWWRIACEVDASGYCWVTADSSLTTPTSAP